MIPYNDIHCCLPWEPCTIYVLWACLLALQATEGQAMHVDSLWCTVIQAPGWKKRVACLASSAFYKLH